MHPCLAPVVDELSPLGLGELEAAAALLDRIDNKYVVSAESLAAVLSRLDATHRVLEIDGRREFAYRSTYFDTASLSTFRHHVQQRRRRYKVRAREYVDAGLCSFEVKLKGARGRTVKHRMTYDPALDHMTAEAVSFLAASVQREYGQAPSEAMQPTLTMRFDRITLVAAELGERLTIDMGLSFRGPAGEVGHMLPGFAIVESKSASGRASIDGLLRRAGIRPERACSKYCLGIGLLRPEERVNAFRPLLRRHFDAEPDAPQPPI